MPSTDTRSQERCVSRISSAWCRFGSVVAPGDAAWDPAGGAAGCATGVTLGTGAGVATLTVPAELPWENDHHS